MSGTATKAAAATTPPPPPLRCARGGGTAERRVRAVGKMGGALAHVAEGAAVPEHQGALSTTYSIEVVDW